MKIAGIIAEYNPFHNGHAYHIKKTRELLGEDTAIVCAMSGNTVQRGDFSIISKHCRAKSAILNGVNLVIEIPSPWVLSSAERYAKGAVSLLNSFGCIDYLSFGSESGDIGALINTADFILSKETDSIIKSELKNGVTYAVARHNAIKQLSGSDMDSIKSPNNILGIEYIKAIKKLGSDILPITIPRHGANHDSSIISGSIASASNIRSMIFSGISYSDYMPQSSLNIIKDAILQGKGPVSSVNSESSVLSVLRSLSNLDYVNLPDNSEGLSNRLMRFARTCISIEEILSLTKTKRYTMSRIRRMLMCAYLGIDNSFENIAPPYIRVLAADSIGIEILHYINETAKLPIITKPAAAKKLTSLAKDVFELEAHITDMYVMAYSDKALGFGGQEWITGPVICK